MSYAQWVAYYEAKAERRLAFARYYLAVAESYRRGFSEESMRAADAARAALDATPDPSIEGEASCLP